MLASFVPLTVQPVRALSAVQASTGNANPAVLDKCCGDGSVCDSGNGCGPGKWGLCSSAVFCGSCLTSQVFALTLQNRQTAQYACLGIGAVLAAFTLTYFVLYAANAMAAASVVSTLLLLASFALVFGSRARSREMRDGKANCMCDCCLAFFCPQCSLCQLVAYHDIQYTHPFALLEDGAKRESRPGV